jgi:hypothetical protein
MLKHALMFALCVTLAAAPAMMVAQEVKDARAEEVKAQVPALQKFHTPIYKLWHTAWPKKDTAMMASLWPEIEKGIAEIAAAELPGILRDKKGAWQEGLKQLQDVAALYKTAMAGAELQPKLDAAERLHMQYEKMTRVIRPAMKEVEAFHQVLYMIYHYYLPERKMDTLKIAVTELCLKMDTLDAAKLPERLMKKDVSFQAARAKLSTSVAYVKGVMASKDEKKIVDAIRRMHSDYETLEKVFE